MSQRIKNFLRIIADEKWHVFHKLPKNIGVKTVELCIEQGLVRTKKIDRKRDDDLETYRIALRITAKGKSAL